MNPYVYSALDDELNIRLVHILPGETAAPISVSIVHGHLKDKVQYECLSYAWGNPDLACSITVVPDGDAASPPSMGSSLAISTNLFEALPYLRDAKRSRTFWIDAICIDQGNLAERGRQVGIMRQIYSGAERVVVWLGKASPTSGRALHFLDEMGRSVKNHFEHWWTTRPIEGIPWEETPSRSRWEDWQAGRTQPGKEEHIVNGFPVLYEAPLVEVFKKERNPDWEALDELLARPWWSRAWVVQEVWCARDRDAVLLQCGVDTLPWDLVRLALNYEESWDDMGNSIRWEAGGRDNEERWQLWPSLKRRYGLAIHVAGQRVKGSPLSSLLWNTWDRDAADPRDKIYAVMDLAGDHSDGGYEQGRVPIKPDYTKPLEQVYTEVAAEIMKRSKTLDYVLLAASNRKGGRNLPSWVPDWRREVNDERPTLFVNRQRLYSMYLSGSMEKMVTWGHGYIAAGDSTPVIELDGTLQILSVKAFIFDEILKYVPTFLANQSGSTDGIKEYIDTAVTMARHLVSLPDETMQAEVERVLAAGAPSKTANFDSSLHEVMSSILPHRKFLVTQAHRLALGPETAEIGDKIAIIAGCNYPMILRNDDCGGFRLIGEAFVPGVMQGELLGFKQEIVPSVYDEVEESDDQKPELPQPENVPKTPDWGTIRLQ